MEGFIKLHRRILSHAWLNDRPEYRVAWEDILLMGDHKTGKVVLRDIPAKKFFSSSGWSRFIARLIEDGMLSQLETLNQGCRSGKIQTALITKYHDYHVRPEGANSRQGRPPLEAPEGALSSGRAAGEQRESIRASGTANPQGQDRGGGGATGEPFYIGLQEVEEVKEKNDRPEMTDSRAYATVAYIIGHYHAEWLRDERGFNFGRAVGRWGERLETLWQLALKHDNRKPRDRPIFRFQDAVEGILDLGVKPEGDSFSMVAPRGPALPALRPGDDARTPDGTTHTILDITRNGMVVFEDDAGPYHLKQLSMVGAAA